MRERGELAVATPGTHSISDARAGSDNSNQPLERDRYTSNFSRKLTCPSSTGTSSDFDHANASRRGAKPPTVALQTSTCVSEAARLPLSATSGAATQSPPRGAPTDHGTTLTAAPVPMRPRGASSRAPSRSVSETTGAGPAEPAAGSRDERERRTGTRRRGGSARHAEQARGRGSGSEVDRMRTK